MTPEWFIWYALHIGINYKTAVNMPVTLLYDLIAIEQIKMEGLRYSKPMTEQEKLRQILDMK